MTKPLSKMLGEVFKLNYTNGGVLVLVVRECGFDYNGMERYHTLVLSSNNHRYDNGDELSTLKSFLVPL